MEREVWRIRVDNEIQRAREAREAGNEGMARVCARRAAGVIVGEYLQRRGLDQSGPSAYDRLRFLQSLDDVPSQVQQIVGHFLERVTPDHTLPAGADLLSEADRLEKMLLETEG